MLTPMKWNLLMIGFKATLYVTILLICQKQTLVMRKYNFLHQSQWHFCNDEKDFDYDKFKQMSTFNSRNTNVEIGLYFGSFREKLKLRILIRDNQLLRGKDRIILRRLRFMRRFKMTLNSFLHSYHH